jgi:nitroimidazol reductase NimA-like FMN-containing flavoprotein (pyridoxamine 5'-phosphate oxidase superfamily)
MPRRFIERTEIDEILAVAKVGHLSMNGRDGYPYTIPVHFVYESDKIYIHGGMAGTKIENLSADGRVCFEVSEMRGVFDSEDRVACDIGTDYSSVIIFGTATFLSDLSKKDEILHKIVDKLAPGREDEKLPEAMVSKTNIIEISIERITGKELYKN